MIMGTLVGLWSSISANPLFRKIVVVLGLVLAVLFALAGFRRSAEKAGRLAEREKVREEAKKTDERVKVVEKKMAEVPRPSTGGTVDRLRGGTF
jgi:hypothetical protein